MNSYFLYEKFHLPASPPSKRLDRAGTTSFSIGGIDRDKEAVFRHPGQMENSLQPGAGSPASLRVARLASRVISLAR
jgi:hypothetical protein